MKTIFLKSGEYRNGVDIVRVSENDVKIQGIFEIINPEPYVNNGSALIVCMIGKTNAIPTIEDKEVNNIEIKEKAPRKKAV